MGRRIVSNGRTSGDVGAFADGDGRDQLCVAADERMIFNNGAIFINAIVIHRNNAGANINPFANSRITQIA